MQLFNAIYKKGNMLQCRFSDNFLHPDYIGYEFPIGHHLISAVAYDKELAKYYFAELVKAYISYLENKTEENFRLYEKALYRIDDYCIYLHQVSYVLIKALTEAHPTYNDYDLLDITEYYCNDETFKIFEGMLKRVKKDGHVQTTECLEFWDYATDCILDWFEYLTEMIRNNFYEIAKLPAEITGTDRIAYLNNDSREYIYKMDFPTRISPAFGKSVDSRFYMSQCFNENSAAYSISHCTTEQLMFYDFSLTLDNNIPVKICKNCNQPFIPKGRIDSLYCDRLMPGTTNKCSAVGSINTYKSNLSDVELAYYAATRRYNTRVSRNPLLKPEFEAWKIKAREKLTAYREGNLPADEFRNWFMDDEWMKTKNI